MTSIQLMPRCVVTGDVDGKSTVISDSTISNVNNDFPDLPIADIWVTDTSPVDLERKVEIKNTVFPVTPKNGSYFRYITIPPEETLFRKLNIEVKTGEEHPFMHATDTIDYIIVTQGEIYLILEEEEVLLKAGDVAIQRGTNHSWSNRTKEPCSFYVVLLDASVKRSSKDS
jgi:quercetin dioxygenase-like cupin family protein